MKKLPVNHEDRFIRSDPTDSARTSSGNSLLAPTLGAVTRAQALGAAFLAACALAIQLGPYLRMELLDRDEAYYRTFAMVASRGGRLYADFWETHFPALYYLYALVVKGAGDMMTLRLIMIVTVWTGALLFYVLLRRAVGRGTALLGVTAFALIVTSQGLEGRSVNTEHFIQTCVMGAVLASVTGSSRRLLLAGALIGIATLFKQQAILYLAVPIAMHWRGTGRIRNLAILGSGAALPILLVLAWAASEGILDSMIRCTTVELFSQRLGSIGLLPRTVASASLLAKVFENSPSIVLGGMLGLSLLWHQRAGSGTRAEPSSDPHFEGSPRRASAHSTPIDYDVVPDLVWIGAGCLGIALAGRPFPHYAILLVAPALRMALVASDWTRPGRLVSRAAGSALLVFVGADAAFDAVRTIESQVGEHGTPASIPDWDEVAVASYLDSRLDPDDSIFVWGPRPALYVLAGRVPSNRFVDQGALVPGGGSADGLLTELTESLRRHAPAYFIVAPAPPEYALDRPGLEPLEKLLRSSYELERSIHGYELCRLRRAPGHTELSPRREP